MLFLVLWIICGVAGYMLMDPYGRKWEGAGVGFILGPIGIVIVFIMRMNADKAAKGGRE